MLSIQSDRRNRLYISDAEGKQWKHRDSEPSFSNENSDILRKSLFELCYFD